MASKQNKENMKFQSVREIQAITAISNKNSPTERLVFTVKE